MEKNNLTDAQDPFSPGSEPDGDAAVITETKKRRGRVSGYFRITMTLVIILWVTDFLVLSFDARSFAALTVFCLLYTAVMAVAFVSSRAI